MRQAAGTMKGYKVLAIDDDRAILELLARIFEGRSAEFYTARNGEEGLRQFYEQQPDLVILDIMMPGMDGWQTLRQIRQLSEVPVIILSVLRADSDVVRGFDLGAHDFVSKPFSIAVLLARAERLLRQGPGGRSTASAGGIFDDGRLRIDVEGQQVWVEGKPVELTRTEHAVLAFLVRHQGQVLSINQILAAVWGWEVADRAEYVHTYVSRLRRKLEADPSAPAYIITEHGLGYRFARRPE